MRNLRDLRAINFRLLLLLILIIMTSLLPCISSTSTDNPSLSSEIPLEAFPANPLPRRQNDSLVIVGLVDGSVVCLDGTTGSTKWSLNTGGPLISKTGSLKQPFIPSLSGDATLFQLMETPAGLPKLRRMGVTLNTLLQPTRMEHQGHMLLTSKENRFYEVDYQTGELCDGVEPSQEEASACPATTLQIVRYEITTRGINVSSKNKWSYAMGGYLLSVPTPPIDSDQGPWVEEVGDDEANTQKPLLLLEEDDQNDEICPEAARAPSSAPNPLMVRKNGHKPTFVACRDGMVLGVDDVLGLQWRKNLGAPPVAMYVLENGELHPQPLFMQSSTMLFSELATFGSAPAETMPRSSFLLAKLATQPPSVIVDVFDGLRYALVVEPNALPDELQSIGPSHVPLIEQGPNQHVPTSDEIPLASSLLYPNGTCPFLGVPTTGRTSPSSTAEFCSPGVVPSLDHSRWFKPASVRVPPQPSDCAVVPRKASGFSANQNLRPHLPNQYLEFGRKLTDTDPLVPFADAPVPFVSHPTMKNHTLGSQVFRKRWLFSWVPFVLTSVVALKGIPVGVWVLLILLVVGVWALVFHFCCAKPGLSPTACLPLLEVSNCACLLPFSGVAASSSPLLIEDRPISNQPPADSPTTEVVDRDVQCDGIEHEERLEDNTSSTLLKFPDSPDTTACTGVKAPKVNAEMKGVDEDSSEDNHDDDDDEEEEEEEEVEDDTDADDDESWADDADVGVDVGKKDLSQSEDGGFASKFFARPSDFSSSEDDEKNTKKKKNKKTDQKKKKGTKKEKTPTSGSSASSTRSSNAAKSGGRAKLTEAQLTNQQQQQHSSLFQANYEFIGQIGRGGFGRIFRVRGKTDQKEYALKAIALSRRLNAEELRKVKNEAVVLANFDHQNVVRYYNSWVEDDSPNSGCTIDHFLRASSLSGSVDDNSSSVFSEGTSALSSQSASQSVSRSTPSRKSLGGGHSHLYILMEFYPDGTLADRYQRLCEHKIGVNLVEHHDMFRQLIRGLRYVHGEGVLHRDLKPSNVFIGKANVIKIGDFGLSCGQRVRMQASTGDDNGDATQEGPMIVFGDSDDEHAGDVEDGTVGMDMTTGIGSPLYSAPEQYTGGPTAQYNQAADIFSLGMIFFEGFIRPGTASERVTLLTTLRSKHRVPPKLMQEYPEEMQLVLQMTKTDPVLRPSLETVHDITRRLRHRRQDELRSKSKVVPQNALVPPSLPDTAALLPHSGTGGLLPPHPTAASNHPRKTRKSRNSPMHHSVSSPSVVDLHHHHPLLLDEDGEEDGNDVGGADPAKGKGSRKPDGRPSAFAEPLNPDVSDFTRSQSQNQNQHPVVSPLSSSTGSPEADDDDGDGSSSLTTLTPLSDGIKTRGLGLSSLPPSNNPSAGQPGPSSSNFHGLTASAVTTSWRTPPPAAARRQVSPPPPLWTAAAAAQRSAIPAAAGVASSSSSGFLKGSNIKGGPTNHVASPTLVNMMTGLGLGLGAGLGSSPLSTTSSSSSTSSDWLNTSKDGISPTAVR